MNSLFVHRARGTRSLMLLAVVSLSLPLGSAEPAWWSQRGVIDAGQQRNDYAAVNTGQLKQMAKQAMLEFDAKLSGGAGTAIHQLVDAWPAQTTGRDDFAAINIGQLKTVAKLFYARLNQAGYALPFPWSDLAPDRNDYAAANIGQLKAVFSFAVDYPPQQDSDSDNLPDWWEYHCFAGLTQSSANDADSDNMNNMEEYLLGTNPSVASTSVPNQQVGLIVHTPINL